MPVVASSVRARPHLLTMVMVVVAALLATQIPADEARAQIRSCEEAWSELVAWTVDEQNGGLSTEGLDILRSLQPDLEGCSASDANDIGVGSDRWRALVGVYFPDDEVDRVVCLMELESGGNPGARNPSSGASGLMQVMPDWAGVFGYQPEDLFDPLVNLWVASRIREQQGWGAWSPFQRGSCR